MMGPGWTESTMEAESRQAANFADIEGKLIKRWSKSDTNMIDKATSSEAILLHALLALLTMSRPTWIAQLF